MSVTLSIKNNRMTLTAEGRLDFDSIMAFNETANKGLETPDLTAIVVDLRQTSYLDSSAIGALMILRDRAASKGINAISLAGIHGNIRASIEMFRLKDMFNLIP